MTFSSNAGNKPKHFVLNQIQNALTLVMLYLSSGIRLACIIIFSEWILFSYNNPLDNNEHFSKFNNRDRFVYNWHSFDIEYRQFYYPYLRVYEVISFKLALLMEINSRSAEDPRNNILFLYRAQENFFYLPIESSSWL